MSNGSKRKNARATVPLNALADNCWPALPDAPGARMLALQYQLGESQWWSAQRLRESQFRQLSVLLQHARDTVPFYRERLANLDLSRGLDVQSLAAVPLLARQDIQTNFERLISARVPAEHGKLVDGETSGSSGRPLRYRTTELASLFWQVFTLRDHLWHQRDFRGKLASIRGRVQPGTAQGWGVSTDVAYRTGTMSAYNTDMPLREQAQWLLREDPDYLVTIASNARALAAYCGEGGLRPRRLREVRTYGEALHSDIRAICRQAWDVPVVDMYSCAEGGYLALQCPEHEHYHVQSESVWLEVLNPQGLPCAPGETGKVVITPLHNFEMPLLRYDLGDYAEVGPSNLHALARHAAELGMRLNGLREARTFGEMVPRDLRSLCRDVWKVPVSDLYLAKETGYIALQCPEHEQYHVQSESVLVEILDQQSKPCVPHQVGRVVVTPLQNFAMPLLRYDLGDYAEVGEPCACGRGLPVLRRIIGRARDKPIATPSTG